MFSKELGEKLDQYHLLKHPFYQVFWNEGKLTREIIKDYAEQYYQHVKAFPRYISATHSICKILKKEESFWKIYKTKNTKMEIILSYGRILQKQWDQMLEKLMMQNRFFY